MDAGRWLTAGLAGAALLPAITKALLIGSVVAVGGAAAYLTYKIFLEKRTPEPVRKGLSWCGSKLGKLLNLGFEAYENNKFKKEEKERYDRNTQGRVRNYSRRGRSSDYDPNLDRDLDEIIDRYNDTARYSYNGVRYANEYEYARANPMQAAYNRRRDLELSRRIAQGTGYDYDYQDSDNYYRDDRRIDPPYSRSAPSSNNRNVSKPNSKNEPRKVSPVNNSSQNNKEEDIKRVSFGRVKIK